MFSNSTPRAYVVTIRHWPDPAKPAHEDHEVKVDAYDLAEALIQGSMKLQVEGGIGGPGNKTEVVGIRPNTAKKVEDLLGMMFGAAEEGRRR